MAPKTGAAAGRLSPELDKEPMQDHPTHHHMRSDAPLPLVWLTAVCLLTACCAAPAKPDATPIEHTSAPSAATARTEPPVSLGNTSSAVATGQPYAAYSTTKSCISATDCEPSQQCEGPCGQAVCMRPRRCTRDLRPYCGCDGKTFRSSGSCPGRPFSKRGPCDGTKKN